MTEHVPLAQLPPDYIARRSHVASLVDGDMSAAAWRDAEWSRRFVDMASGGPGVYETRVAIVWDDTYLHIAFIAEEPFVNASLTERDSIIFQENDLELFIDGGDCYYELEVNAANTVYEVLFVWRDACTPGCRFDIPNSTCASRLRTPSAATTTARPAASGTAPTPVASVGRSPTSICPDCTPLCVRHPPARPMEPRPLRRVTPARGSAG